MKFIEPSVEEITFTEYGKKIEYAGRICYKSQDKIEDSSHISFINSIAKRGHLSVIEHEKFSLLVKIRVYTDIKFIFESKEFTNMFFDISFPRNDRDHIVITGNIRAWKELLSQVFENELCVQLTFTKYFGAISNFLHTRYGDLFNIVSLEHGYKLEDFACEAKDYWLIENLSKENVIKHIYKTFHITTDRAVTHQFVRHRRNSFSQESQRYCNYTIGKFDSSIRFIIPSGFEDAVQLLKENNAYNLYTTNYPDIEAIKVFFDACKYSEDAYFKLIDKKIKPEVARSVLPNCTATEIISTANIEQWNRFLGLRCDSHAQADIRKIAEMIKSLI